MGPDKSLAEYLKVLDGLGFEVVLDMPFAGLNNTEERFRVCWRPDGLLLCFDTFLAESVNSARVYYNWRPHQNRVTTQADRRIVLGALESGGWRYPGPEIRDLVEGDRPGSDVWDAADRGNPVAKAAVEGWFARKYAASVWAGYHDARWHLDQTLGTLDTLGRFVTPWVADPRPWLLHYKDPYANGEHSLITETRIAMLPAAVQAAIRPGGKEAGGV